MMRKRFPAIALFFLSTAMGELLSGSSPPLQFFNPFALLFMGLLYGGGAILIRELALRWNKGWPTIIAMGAAYGIIEEGIMCKSFFDPNWMDLGPMRYYGRWLEVNWPWTLNLIIFHTFVSITIPILLIGFIYPDMKGKPLVSPKGFNILAGLFAADVILGFALMKPPTWPKIYYPSPVHVILTLGIVSALIRWARRLPISLGAGRSSAPHPHWMLVVGFLFGLGFFAVLFVLPTLKVHPMLDMLAAITLVAVGIYIIYRWSCTDTAWPGVSRVVLAAVSYVLLVPFALLTSAVLLDRLKVPALPAVALLLATAVWAGIRIPRWSSRRTRWSSRHILALTAGGLSPFILISFALPYQNAQNPDDTTGMSLVGISAIIFLAWLWRKVSRQEAREDGDVECTLISHQAS